MDLLIYKYLIMMTDTLGLVAYLIRSSVYVTGCGLDWISNTPPQAIPCHVLGVRVLILPKKLRLGAFPFLLHFWAFQIVWFGALSFGALSSDWLEFLSALVLCHWGLLEFEDVLLDQLIFVALVDPVWSLWSSLMIWVALDWSIDLEGHLWVVV